MSAATNVNYSFNVSLPVHGAARSLAHSVRSRERRETQSRLERCAGTEVIPIPHPTSPVHIAPSGYSGVGLSRVFGQMQ